MAKKENELLALASQFITEEVQESAKTGEGLEDAVVSLGLPIFQFLTGQSHAVTPGKDAYDEDARPFTFYLSNAPTGVTPSLGKEAVVQFLKAMRLTVYKDFNPDTYEFREAAVEPALEYAPRREKFTFGDTSFYGQVVVRDGKQVYQSVSTEYRTVLRVLTIDQEGKPVWTVALAYLSSYRESNFRDFLSDLKKKQGEEALFSRLWKINAILEEGKNKGTLYKYQFTPLGAANEQLVSEARELYLKAVEDLKLCLKPIQPQAVAQITGGAAQPAEVLPPETPALPGPPPALNLY